MIVKILEKYKAWLFSGIMMMCCVWIACHQHLYADVDNYFISMVINGLYFNEDNYVQYLHPLLSELVFVMKKIAPRADCFSLLMRGMLIGGAGWISYLLAERMKYFSLACVAGICILAVAKAGGIFGVNYTVVAALLSFCGLFSISVAFFAEKGKVRIALWGTLFLCLGLMLRRQSGLLALPFLLVALAAEGANVYCGGNKERCLELLKIGAIPCVAVALLLISNQVFWATGRADNIRYDAGRVALVDYPVKPWEEIEQMLPGVREVDYSMVRSWCFADTEVMDAEFMETVSKVAAVTPQLNMMTLKQGNKTIWDVLCGPGVKIYAVWIFAVFLMILVLPTNKFERIEAILAIAGGYIIMLYLSLKGRFPERVCIAVCLPIIAILTSIAMKAMYRPDLRRAKACALAMLMCFLAGSQFSNLSFPKEFSPLAINAGMTADDSAYRETYEGNAVYICSGQKLLTFAGQGKLPTDEFLRHYVSCGDWTYGQSYQIQHLNSIGISNPIKSLITRENTYLLSGDCSLVQRFLQEHYAPNVESRQVGEIDGEAVWEFYIP